MMSSLQMYIGRDSPEVELTAKVSKIASLRSRRISILQIGVGCRSSRPLFDADSIFTSERASLHGLFSTWCYGNRWMSYVSKLPPVPSLRNMTALLLNLVLIHADAGGRLWPLRVLVTSTVLAWVVSTTASVSSGIYKVSCYHSYYWSLWVLEHGVDRRFSPICSHAPFFLWPYTLASSVNPALLRYEKLMQWREERKKLQEKENAMCEDSTKSLPII